jgi:MshEN domain
VAEEQHRDIRIGRILIEQGVLSEQQVFEIAQAQKTTGVPFGVLAERMFDVTVESVEQAWIEQYCRFTGTIDLSVQEIDAEALRLINRRQAWQFEILPLRFEPEGELLMAASRARLARAVTFAANRLQPMVFFRVADSQQLRQFLSIHYPMPEVSDEILRRARELVHEG